MVRARQPARREWALLVPVPLALTGTRDVLPVVSCADGSLLRGMAFTYGAASVGEAASSRPSSPPHALAFALESRSAKPNTPFVMVAVSWEFLVP